MNVIPIFPTPIAVDKIQLGNIDFIKSVPMVALDAGNGFSSIDRQILEQPEWFDIKQKLQKVVNDYFYEYLQFDSKIKIRISNSWLVKFPPSGWAWNHYHDHSIFSGCLYLNVDETIPETERGMISFTKSQNLAQFGTPPLITIPYSSDYEPNMFTCSKYNYSPKNADVVIFPSVLSHSVSENKSNEDRYSLAFNTFVSGTFGEKDGEVTLYHKPEVNDE